MSTTRIMKIRASEHEVPFYPEALQTARALRGVSQADLADKVGLSRQHINKLERGEVKSLPELQVHELAAALRVPASYLGTATGPVPSEEALHFRKKRPPSWVIEQLQVQGNLFARLVTQLEKYVRLSPVNVPQVRARDADDIEGAAALCRAEWGLRGDNPIAHMTRVLERAGACVGRFNLKDESVDAFSWFPLAVPHQRPLVMCNSSTESATRNRYSLAHELGHMVLHRGMVTGDTITEKEAHRFAGAFLLPKVAFFREFPRSRTRIHWEGLLEMKQRWGVSIQAILHRASDLALLNGPSYRSAYVRLSQLGWRKQEPEEPDLEVPELVQSVVASLASRGISPHSLALEMGFSVSLLETAAGVRLQEPPPLDPELHGAINLLARLNRPQQESPFKKILEGVLRPDESGAPTPAPVQTLQEADAKKLRNTAQESPFRKILEGVLRRDESGAPTPGPIQALQEADAKRLRNVAQESPFKKILEALGRDEPGAPTPTPAQALQEEPWTVLRDEKEG